MTQITNHEAIVLVVILIVIILWLLVYIEYRFRK